MNKHTSQKADLLEDNFFKEIFMKHGAVMLLLEPETGAIIEANFAAARFYGYSIEQLLKMKIDDINTLSPAEIKKVRLKVLSNEKNYFIFNHRLANGELKKVEVHSSPILYNGNNILFSVIHDKTSAFDLETKFKGIFDYSPNCIFLSDLSGKFVDCNNAATEHFGYSKEEILSKRVVDITYQDDLKSTAAAIKDMLTGEKKSVMFEKRYIKKDGTTFWANLHSALYFDENRNPKYFIAHIKDISARKNAENRLKDSEEKYRTIVSSANEGILLQDGSGVILNWNKEAQRIFGVAESEIVGKTPFTRKWNTIYEDGSYFPTEQHPSHITLKTGKPCKNVLMGVKYEDDSINWINVNTNPIFSEGNSSPGYVVICFSDITEIKNSQDEIKKREAELSVINAEKDRFFSIIAHDLRSPFSGFLGFTEILANNINSFSPDEIGKMCKNLNISAANLYELLNNLLQWSMVKRKVSTYNPKPVLIKRAIEDAINNLSNNIEKKEIIVNINCLESFIAFADLEMLEVILRNLISNAIKFSEHGNKIEISAGKEDNYIIISVKDYGIGIDKKMQSELFDITANTRRKGTEGEASSGLGLILCKEFIDYNKGKLWLESEPGLGSTFHFSLPAMC